MSSQLFKNEIDFIMDFTLGEFDAIFWGGYPIEKIGNEVKEKDGRVRLVRIVEANSSIPDNGYVWYCLSEPLGEAFVFPVLDRLRGETVQRDEVGLLIKSRGAVMNLPFSRIRCVEVLNKNVYFHLDNGKTEEIRGSLSDFEARLLHCPDFIKVHRSYIINLCHVEKMEANSVLLCGGYSVPVSRQLYTQMKKDWLCRLMDPSVMGESGESTVTVPTTEYPKESYSILLVDDEEDDRNRFAEFLESKGCRVCTAKSGEEAQEKALNGHFDCVLLDVLLGAEKGFDLCQSLMGTSGAPVVYLSNLKDGENQIHGFLSGGIDYITKDTGMELFWMKIETRIVMARSVKAELSSGNFHLDLKNRRAFIGHQEVFLNTVEFDLLCFLMHNPNIVYSPSQLYEMVWGTKQRDDGQSVQLHMSSLWRKLESVCPGQGFLETVWGIGYRFSPLVEGGGQNGG